MGGDKISLSTYPFPVAGSPIEHGCLTTSSPTEHVYEHKKILIKRYCSQANKKRLKKYLELVYIDNSLPDLQP